MSLLFNNIQPAGQTHVLLIGVGVYPYLKGGALERQPSDEGWRSLGQLSSPMASVKAFYDLAIEFHQETSWTTPLGSIEVLISASPQATALDLGEGGRPTMQNIRKAYREWRVRCNSDENNVAMFLFCGHGLEKSEQILLSEDFGENDLNPWDGSFSFDATRRAFHIVEANTQCFFVDACRQLTQDMLEGEIPLTPLEVPKIGATDCLHNLTMQAAARNESAFGKKNYPSFFTNALMNALKGRASFPVDDEWLVNTTGISSSIHALLGEEMTGQNYEQRCVIRLNGEMQLIRLVESPDTVLSITCDPAAALDQAELAYRHHQLDQRTTRPPNAAPWDITVPSGIYNVTAEFQDGNYNNTGKLVAVYPPKTITTLRCQ